MIFESEYLRGELLCLERDCGRDCGRLVDGEDEEED